MSEKSFKTSGLLQIDLNSGSAIVITLPTGKTRSELQLLLIFIRPAIIFKTVNCTIYYSRLKDRCNILLISVWT